MIQDRQVKRLWRVLALGKTLAQSADKAGMDELARLLTRDHPARVSPVTLWRCGRGQIHVFGLWSSREKRFPAEKWTSPQPT